MMVNVGVVRGGCSHGDNNGMSVWVVCNYSGDEDGGGSVENYSSDGDNESNDNIDNDSSDDGITKIAVVVVNIVRRCLCFY